MKKNKKLLMSFLALNALIPTYLKGAETPLSLKYDKLYNKITKNIELGKSNDDSYRLLEKVLNQIIPREAGETIHWKMQNIIQCQLLTAGRRSLIRVPIMKWQMHSGLRVCLLKASWLLLWPVIIM